MKHQLTIVIPTKNRSQFLSRALGYYREVGCPFPILLGDSSDAEHLESTKRSIEEIGDGLEVHHLIDPGAKGVNAAGWQTDFFLRDLLDHVETPYVALYADDDFAVVKNLSHAVDYLEAHGEYSFVCGHASLFTLESGTASGQLVKMGRYLQRGYDDHSPSVRLNRLLTDYSVLEYGVSRTQEKQYRWNKVFEAEVDNLTGELINCCLVVLQGKVKLLDRLLLVRQAHAGQTSLGPGSVFDWASTSLFPDRYNKLKDIVSHVVSERTGSPLDEAEQLFKRSFWFYLGRALWNSHPDNAEAARHWGWRRWAKTLPGAHLMMGKLRGVSGRGLSLQAALNPTSPYHADFMPVYRAITGARAT